MTQKANRGYTFIRGCLAVMVGALAMLACAIEPSEYDEDVAALEAEAKVAACSPRKCGSGQTFNTESCACEATCSPRKCGSGQTFNTESCACEATCSPRKCAAGQKFNTET